MAPIFIGGAERSGTTFLGSLFGCVEGACVTEESGFKSDWQFPQERDWPAFRDRIGRLWRFRNWNIGDISDLPPSSEREFLETLVRRFAQRDVSYWVDHTPRNIADFDHLKQVFPEARFVNLIRDGRAVAASMMPLEWGPNTPAACAHRWVRDVGTGLAAVHRHPDDVTTIYYEDLVLDPVKTMNRVFAFLDLEKRVDKVEDLISKAEFLPAYAAAGQHRDVGRPPNASSIDKWRERLTAKQIGEFEYVAGPLLRMLGYDLVGGTRRPTAASRLRSAIYELWRTHAVNPPRFRKLRGIT